MSTAMRRTLQVDERPRVHAGSNNNGQARSNGSHAASAANGDGLNGHGATRKSAVVPSVKERPRPRVYIAADNRLLREALSRMLSKNGDIEVVGGEATDQLPTLLQGCLQSISPKADPHSPTEPMMPVAPLREDADILLLSSKGNLEQDLAAIRKVRCSMPNVLILLIDASGDEMNFLQCIRAGIRGYLPRDASADEVGEAVRALHAGRAVCSGTLCTVLFRYVEREATCFPSAIVHQRLGLTRREQQLIPLVAEGLTNKEIANHFCLSEQTVKNHLYRMKHKVGADDRLGIVQMCRTQGFLV